MRSERGVAMPAVVLVLALLTIIVVGSVRTVEDEVKASRQMRESAKAFYAAEAGVEFIMANWDSLQYDTAMANPGDTLVVEWIDLPENGAAFRAVLQRVDDGSQLAFSVRAQGRGGVAVSAGRSVSAILQPAGGSGLSPFVWAMFGGKQTKLENTPVIDGNIGTNGYIEISNNPIVIGDAQAGDSIVGNTSSVTGTITENTPWSDSLPTVPCPPIPWGPPPPPGSYKSFNASIGHITIQGASPAVFSGGVYLFNNFTKGGDNDLVVPPGETAIIYVRGAFTYGGTGDANSLPNPASSLQFYACGTSGGNWNLGGGGSVINMVAYNPRGVITLLNQADAYGSFVADKIKKSNNGTIRYDSSAASVLPPGWTSGGGGTAKLLKRTWTEF